MKFDVATIEMIFAIANAGLDLFNRIRDAAAASPEGALTAEEIRVIIETQYAPKQDELDAQFNARTDDEVELIEDEDDGADE